MGTAIDVDTAAFDLADALGADFVYLEPPEARRIDQAALAITLAVWLLRAVADGITQGARGAAARARAGGPAATVRAGTVRAVTALVRKYVARAFLAGANRSALAGQCAALRRSVAAAEDASAGLAGELARQLPAAIGAAVRDALRAAGLPAAPALRVERAVHAQVALIVRPDRGGRRRLSW
ncbi:hypothetical protein [Goodfellowiella coeruleoviolacea]|uniref:Uncharacterized protein n=1 Tax=Goodfellowiella coeruleoviolacea TaxID=334858 RepID=A0AAE3GH13_9PSEU|nr:hypothetical protein [Goodfellowiella coeruleoviolacea]MCP2167190.1 hypothetical protein [Goodfellowiella coeruleoviolacea]